METNNEKATDQQNAPGTAAPNDERVEEALKQAEHDIEEDPDFKPDPNDDLDEGEIARLGDEDEKDLDDE